MTDSSEPDRSGVGRLHEETAHLVGRGAGRGAVVTVVLDDGRSATATVASALDSDGLLTVRGVGTPPFEVP